MFDLVEIITSLLWISFALSGVMFVGLLVHDRLVALNVKDE